MKLEDNVFVGMNISHLDLGFNSLRKVPGSSLRKLTAAKTIVLDGNLFYTLEDGALNRISVEFLSISHCPHLVIKSESSKGPFINDVTKFDRTLISAFSTSVMRKWRFYLHFFAYCHKNGYPLVT